MFWTKSQILRLPSYTPPIKLWSRCNQTLQNLAPAQKFECDWVSYRHKIFGVLSVCEILCYRLLWWSDSIPNREYRVALTFTDFYKEYSYRTYKNCTCKNICYNFVSPIYVRQIKPNLTHSVKKTVLQVKAWSNCTVPNARMCMSLNLLDIII